MGRSLLIYEVLRRGRVALLKLRCRGKLVRTSLFLDNILRKLMKYLTILALLFLPSFVQAQNCLPKPSAVGWLDEFSSGAGDTVQQCYRVDYLFTPRHEAWFCGNNWVLDFPPEFLNQSGTTTGRIWYLVYRGLFDFNLYPAATLFCRCSSQSCEVRAWR
jgi:hypothetical protein